MIIFAENKNERISIRNLLADFLEIWKIYSLVRSNGSLMPWQRGIYVRRRRLSRATRNGIDEPLCHFYVFERAATGE